MVRDHSKQTVWRQAGVVLLLLASPGCHRLGSPPVHPVPAPLGALSEPVFGNQVANAARSDFVVYQHEFQGNTEYLNTGGEDHLKQIALRLLSGQDAQVLVERSMTSPRPETEFQFPVHPDPDLDLRRWEIVVRALEAMGVADARTRVIVAPALAAGMSASEAVATLQTAPGGSSPRAAGGAGPSPVGRTP